MEKGAKKALKTDKKATTEGPEMLIEIREDKRLECIHIYTRCEYQ